MTKNRAPTPVYLDPGMHSGLEVKGLISYQLHLFVFDDSITGVVMGGGGALKFTSGADMTVIMGFPCISHGSNNIFTPCPEKSWPQFCQIWIIFTHL